jgi:hypothetical protein
VKVRQLVLGTRQTIAGTVYGTIVVLASVTAGAAAYQNNLWKLALIATTSVLVLWLAHVYSHGLGESLALGRRLTTHEFRAIARRELAIPIAAVAPIAFIVLGAVDVFEERTALWLAVAVGVLTLTVQGARYARLENLSRTATIVSVSINLGLGLVIVALKAFVAH